MTEVRPVGAADHGWIEALVRDRWGGDVVVVHGTTYRPTALPGFAAFDRDEPIGLITYRVEGDGCEIVTIDALRLRERIGSRMIDAVDRAARDAGCRRLWLVTTNDNREAQAFYAACGFSVIAVRHGAVDGARAVKPSIPLTNAHGVPIRDEIEMARGLF